MKNGESDEQKDLGNDGSDVATYDHGDFCTFCADATVSSAGFFGRKRKH
jgi:hypothetical protein